MKEKTTVPRPTVDDDRVIGFAAEMMAARLIAKFPRLCVKHSRERLEADLRAVQDIHSDCYDMAKALERKGWRVFAALVVAMHEYDVFEDAERRAVASWVEAEGLEPRFNPGDAVRVPGGDTGEIVEVDWDQANYTVHIPARGHIKSGAPRRAGDAVPSGEVFPFEAVESARPTARRAPRLVTPL